MSEHLVLTVWVVIYGGSTVFHIVVKSESALVKR